MSILWTILIGFIAGVLAKLITPGSNEPQGFILTTILGIVGASLPLTWAKRSAGIEPTRVRVSHRSDGWSRDSASGLGRSDSSAQRSLSTEFFRVDCHDYS